MNQNSQMNLLIEIWVNVFNSLILIKYVTNLFAGCESVKQEYHSQYKHPVYGTYANTDLCKLVEVKRKEHLLNLEV
jgi:hypothetical protein